MGKGYITQAWLVLTLALGFGAALAGMQIAVSERIAENKLNETLNQIPQIVPAADRGRQIERGGRIFYEALADGQRVGWVIPASGSGFAGPIEVLIGVDSNLERITGLYVLAQVETPGLGDKIRDADWRSQFEGKPVEPLDVVTSGEAGEKEIQSLTGATISSEAVTNIVNRAVPEARPLLLGEGGEE
jgi:electron transport complex protein RnfG